MLTQQSSKDLLLTGNNSFPLFLARKIARRMQKIDLNIPTSIDAEFVKILAKKATIDPNTPFATHRMRPYDSPYFRLILSIKEALLSYSS